MPPVPGLPEVPGSVPDGQVVWSLGLVVTLTSSSSRKLGSSWKVKVNVVLTSVAVVWNE